MRTWWRRWGADSGRSTPEYISYVLETRRNWLGDQASVAELLTDLQRYFVDRGHGDRVMSIGSRGLAIENIKTALSHLGFSDLRHKSDVFDEELSSALRSFQKEHHHSSVDGLFGPGTRSLLTSVLFERECRCFSLMADPENRHHGHAFISYASADRGDAAVVSDIVRQVGYSVWWDQDIAGGERWNDEISRQLSSAFLVICIASSNAALSKWVKREVSVADKLEKSILPVTIQAALPPNDLTVFFNNIQPIDRHADDFVARVRQSLMRAHEHWQSSK